MNICIRFPLIILIAFCLDSCNTTINKFGVKAELLLLKEIDYPSGSTLNYYQNKIYLMGDDAQGIRVLDEYFNTLDSLPVFSSGNNRILKPVKPDIESSEIIGDELWLLGSGALSPHRDSLFRVNVASGAVEKIPLAAFYNRLRDSIPQLNIEAFAKIGNRLLLGHRRNKLQTRNYLIETSAELLSTQENAAIKLIPFNAVNTSAGISGMTYYSKQDLLFITCSMEDVANTYDDGAVGESYLAIVPSISRQLANDSVSVFNWIALSSIHEGFQNKKVEAISVTSKKENEFMLYIAADNDNGKTVMFRMKLTIGK